MLTAFGFRPGQPVQVIKDFDRLDDLYKHPDSLVWVDLEEATDEELRRVDTVVNVDDTSLDACLEGDQRPRVDEFEDHLFLLLYGVLSPQEDPTFAPRKLAAFCGSRFLVTIHADRHRSIDALRARFPNHGVHLMNKGVDFVLYTIIDSIVDNYAIALTSFDARLEEIEDLAVEGEGDPLDGTTSILRREMLELRRLAVAQREVLGPLARGECDYIAEDLGRRFSHIVSHLTKVIELTDSLREILSSVRDSAMAVLQRRTNEIMRTLTIFASILLPLSLIAGIYGMNLATWPSMQHPWGFWAVLGFMGTVATTLGIYFWSRRWI